MTFLVVYLLELAAIGLSFRAWRRRKRRHQALRDRVNAYHAGVSGFGS